MVLSFLSNIASSQNKVNITMENVKEICKDEPLEKRVRITVARFNVATSGASSELGENMSTMLTNALQDVNCFRVLESLKHKEDMTGEIDWGSSEYSSGSAAPQKGKMVGAQVVVTGEITEFTQQDKSVNVSFISSSKKIVKLGFIVKMVNPETRDVLFSKSFNVQGRTGGSVNASLLRGLVNFGGGSGNNPAIADNIYLFEPVNDYDNSGAFSPGSTALDAKIKIANQSGDKADIYIYNWIVGAYDTSDANIIIGDGNNITAIAQAKGSSGGVTYKYDYVISGTLTASGLSNIKFAFVMIDNPGAFLVATTGTQRIFHDADGIAELTSTFRLNNQLPPNSTKEPKSIFSK